MLRRGTGKRVERVRGFGTQRLWGGGWVVGESRRAGKRELEGKNELTNE